MRPEHMIALQIFCGVFGYSFIGVIWAGITDRFGYRPFTAFHFLFWPLSLPITLLIVVYCLIARRPVEHAIL